MNYFALAATGALLAGCLRPLHRIEPIQPAYDPCDRQESEEPSVSSKPRHSSLDSDLWITAHETYPGLCHCVDLHSGASLCVCDNQDNLYLRDIEPKSVRDIKP